MLRRPLDLRGHHRRHSHHSRRRAQPCRRRLFLPPVLTGSSSRVWISAHHVHPGAMAMVAWISLIGETGRRPPECRPGVISMAVIAEQSSRRIKGATGWMSLRPDLRRQERSPSGGIADIRVTPADGHPGRTCLGQCRQGGVGPCRTHEPGGRRHTQCFPAALGQAARRRGSALPQDRQTSARPVCRPDAIQGPKRPSQRRGHGSVGETGSGTGHGLRMRPSPFTAVHDACLPHPHPQAVGRPFTTTGSSSPRGQPPPERRPVSGNTVVAEACQPPRAARINPLMHAG